MEDLVNRLNLLLSSQTTIDSMEKTGNHIYVWYHHEEYMTSVQWSRVKKQICFHVKQHQGENTLVYFKLQNRT